MRTKVERLKTWPALAAADLGTGISLAHELPKNFAYVSLILQAIAIVDAGVAAPTRAQDGQHRMYTRAQLKRDSGTPLDVDARTMGLFVEHLHGVLDDVQETAPLAIGANTLEVWHEFPFCDPTVPFASPQWVETIIVGWRRKNLEFTITPPPAVTHMYAAGGGGTIALTSLQYKLFARVLLDPTGDEVAMLAELDKEMRYAHKAETQVAATARAYGVYRDTNLDRDVRFLKLAIMCTDGATAILQVRNNTLDEATIKLGPEFFYPENFDADGVKALNVWDRDFDQVDGFHVINLDQNKDHATAPFASEGAAAEFWRTLAAPVAAGSCDTIQMSVGAAEYPQVL